MGILNKGKAQKREKRPPTQIEIMAAVEREKQEKKAARRAAKVRASPSDSTLAESARNPRKRFPGDFYFPFFCFSHVWGFVIFSVFHSFSTIGFSL